MAASKKPYEQFGPFILFKKLEQDALGDLWRAGVLENGALGETVALRRLTGGNREALIAAATTARDIAPLLSGTSFVKNQTIDVVGGVPYVSYEYANGRSLRHIIDRARGGNGITPNPIPIDQAIVIAEKVALSVSTTSELRYGGNKLNHGALIPHFIWISDDGEIRVAGQQLGKGIVASLKDPAVGPAISRYFSPEYQSTGEPSKGSEVYSLGALLYLLVTGSEPPDAANASAFAQSVRAAKTMTGAPIPDDIRILLDKSLNIDPSRRYASVGDMKQALSALTNSGKYSATTFNLAFYLSNLLKKDMEAEALEREKESKLNLAPYFEAPGAGSHPTPAAAVAVPSFGGAEEPEKKKGKAPLAIAAVGALVAVGIGTWVALGGLKGKPEAAKPVPVAQTATAPAPPKPAFIPAPVVVASSTAATAPTATSTADAEAARKKAFEAAVEQRMQQEMLKLQSDYLKQLQAQKSKNAPVVTAAATEPVPTAAPRTTPAAPENAPSAAQLDAQRREAAAARETPAVPTPAPSTPQPTPQVAASTPSPAAQPVAAARVIREGDVIDFQELDTQPHALAQVRPTYPQLAIRQRIEGTIILTVLISESGNVEDVRVLRGIDKFGMNEAAIRALRSTRFSPPIKDGKRVKTWFPQSVQFKL
ncbi:MAG: TonB family protein [Acidobacteria bacterium]|nr:TonB family protein [Acidobacteriota bacterium]